MDMTMNFTITKEEGLEAAKQAEYSGGNNVTTPGAYVGIVQSAIFKKFDSGAGGLEISMKVTSEDENDGKTCKVMLLTMKKDGTSTYKDSKGNLVQLPGVNQVRGALMPVLRKKELTAVKNGDEFIYPDIVGKKLGMLVNIKRTLGKTGGKPDPKKVYDNPDLKTFFCPATRLCGSEILAGAKTPERINKLIEGLHVKDETAIAEVAGSSNPADPFGDANGAVLPADDPFASAGQTETKEEVKTEVKTEAKVESKAEVKAEVKPEPKVETPAPVDTPAATDSDNFWE